MLTKHASVCRHCGHATDSKEVCSKCKQDVPLVTYLVLAHISPHLGSEGKGLTISRSYGSYFIPSAEDGEVVSLLIEDMVDVKRIVPDDLTQPAENVPYPIPAATIAKDILRTEDLEREGGFICAGDKPTKREIEAARMARHKWLGDCVRYGDDLFSRMGPGAIANIPDFCKRAVSELGETREWVYLASTPKTQCAGCGSFVSKLKDGTDPAVCVHCKAPINRELALELGLWAPPVREKEKASKS